MLDLGQAQPQESLAFTFPLHVFIGQICVFCVCLHQGRNMDRINEKGTNLNIECEAKQQYIVAYCCSLFLLSQNARTGQLTLGI